MARHLLTTYVGDVWTVYGDLRDPAWPTRTNRDVEKAVLARIQMRGIALQVEGDSTDKALMLTVVGTARDADRLRAVVERCAAFTVEQPTMPAPEQAAA